MPGLPAEVPPGTAGPGPGAVSRPELCVGAVIVHDDAIVLVRRGRPPGLGRWSVPGGRVEWGEPMAAAVVREVGEECGLDVVVGAEVGWVERIGDDHHFVIVDFFAVPLDPAQPLQAGDDAAEVRWVPLDEVTLLPLVPGLADFLAEHRVIDLL